MTGHPLQILRLADGRGLAWREYGDPDGAPCVYITGTPASGLAGAAFDEEARRAGVRLVSIDKPGYGASDFDPSRTLLSSAAEVRALADHLGIDRFAVLGQSGGGPFALACASALPDRLTTTVVASGLAPWGRGLELGPMVPGLRFMMRAARSTPFLITPLLASMRRTVARPDAATTQVEKGLAQAVPAERDSAAVRASTLALLPAIRDALRNGSRGAVQELRIVTHDWGFSRSEIRGHVDILHGELDSNVPVSSAVSNAAAIRDSSLELFPDLAHAASAVHAPHIMHLVATAATH
jgi:pimeloyl-ACP methyl ester carboxylesterase